MPISEYLRSTHNKSRTGRPATCRSADFDSRRKRAFSSWPPKIPSFVPGSISTTSVMGSDSCRRLSFLLLSPSRHSFSPSPTSIKVHGGGFTVWARTTGRLFALSLLFGLRERIDVIPTLSRQLRPVLVPSSSARRNVPPSSLPPRIDFTSTSNHHGQLQSGLSRSLRLILVVDQSFSTLRQPDL